MKGMAGARVQTEKKDCTEMEKKERKEMGKTSEGIGDERGNKRAKMRGTER